MKFYETTDVDFYIDIQNSCEKYCTYPQDKTWAIKSLNHIKTINYYRDYEGSGIIMKKLSFGKFKWEKNRIVPWACLPLYYANGDRFIKLEKAGPVGFKCAEFPLSLKELKEKLKHDQLEREKAQKQKGDKWFEKMLAEECKKQMEKEKKKKSAEE